MVIKGGMIIASKMGDANASIPTTQPVFYQPMFAAHGKAKYAACLTFVSQAAYGSRNVKAKLRPGKNSCSGRGLPKHRERRIWYSMTRTPEITVDPETYEVTADGVSHHIQTGRQNFRLHSSTICSKTT